MDGCMLAESCLGAGVVDPNKHWVWAGGYSRHKGLTRHVVLGSTLHHQRRGCLAGQAQRTRDPPLTGEFLTQSAEVVGKAVGVLEAGLCRWI